MGGWSMALLAQLIAYVHLSSYSLYTSRRFLYLHRLTQHVC